MGKRLIPSVVCRTAENDIIAAYREIISWAQAQSQFHDAKDEFAKVADGWLVAYAKAKGATVVTNEKFEAAARKKVKYRTSAKLFDIPYINIFELLRALGIKLG